jgi:hypothetical protein
MTYLCLTKNDVAIFFEKRMMWLLKSLLDQNSIIINHKPDNNFNIYIIFSMT